MLPEKSKIRLESCRSDTSELDSNCSSTQGTTRSWFPFLVKTLSYVMSPCMPSACGIAVPLHVQRPMSLVFSKVKGLLLRSESLRITDQQEKGSRVEYLLRWWKVLTFVLLYLIFQRESDSWRASSPACVFYGRNKRTTKRHNIGSLSIC